MEPLVGDVEPVGFAPVLLAVEVALEDEAPGVDAVEPEECDGLDVAAVIAHVQERIADFKVPQYVAVRTEPLARNPGGKVLKKQLREETEWGEPLR